MAQTKQLRISAINVVTQPHSKENYIQLLKDLFRLRQHVSVRGNEHLLIGELRPHSEKDPYVLVGRFYKFLHVSTNTPWVNLQTNEYASEEDMQTINLPKELLPESAIFNFVFYAKNHTLFFERESNKKKLSPAQVQKFLETISSAEKIKRKYQNIEFTIVPDEDSLDSIFKMPALKRVTIDLKKPNPDDIESITGRVLGRLSGMNARRETRDITAENGKSLDLDQETKDEAKVASLNGKVVAIGYNGRGEREEISTVQYPWTMPYEYNTEKQTPLEALRTATDHIKVNG